MSPPFVVSRGFVSRLVTSGQGPASGGEETRGRRRCERERRGDGGAESLVKQAALYARRPVLW